VVLESEVKVRAALEMFPPLVPSEPLVVEVLPAQIYVPPSSSPVRVGEAAAVVGQGSQGLES
jgi:hypothetical protein